MVRALRTCLVLLLLCAGCGPVDRPTGHGDDDPDPTDLHGGGGWEGSNCMGAAYGITLLDENNQLVTVRDSMAIGVVVDAIRIVSQLNDDGGLEVMVEGLDRFLDVGLRNWLHKIGEVLLPDEEWVAALDSDSGEYGSGHYNVLGVSAPCQLIGGGLQPAVARTLAMFLYALSQMASCPDHDAAEADGNFVSVHVRIQATDELASQLPAAPPSPTLYELFSSFGARPIPPGGTPDPSMTCILRGPPELKAPTVDPPVIITPPIPVPPIVPSNPPIVPVDPPIVTIDTNKPPLDAPQASYHAAAIPGPCLVEARVEAVVTTVPRFHPTFASGPAGEPVAFSGTPVVQSAGALGAASPVRHFLADNHVGTVDEILAFSTCDNPAYAPYGSRVNPCPPALARWHFIGAHVDRAPAALPSDLESALAPIFSIGQIFDGIIVIIPFNASPRCMAECPPERAAPSEESCE
jgi:hypothetical protein